MKKTFILFYLLLSYYVHLANAQISNNTIVNDNSSWATLFVTVYPTPPLVSTQYVYFDGDSIVAGNSYKKVFSCIDKLHESINYEGLIREQNQKTYFIPNSFETEYLIYDFSLEIGMTFEYPLYPGLPETVLLEVKNIDMVEIHGVLKKRLLITHASTDNIVDTWIENVGSLEGILHPSYGLIHDGASMTLLCYYQNNELIYKNPAYSKCYYDKWEDIISVQTIEVSDCSVFPNPIDNILNISCLSNTISRIEIFDFFGKKVYSDIYKNTIDMSSFSKGLYTLKVYETNKQVSVFKIIKK